jgi:hypothetical protein
MMKNSKVEHLAEISGGLDGTRCYGKTEHIEKFESKCKDGC